MPVTQSISHSPFANSECRTVVAPWLERALVVLGDIRKDVRTSAFGGLQCDELERQLRAVALTQKGGWQDQHARDSAELRRLCQARDDIEDPNQRAAWALGADRGYRDGVAAALSPHATTEQSEAGDHFVDADKLVPPAAPAPCAMVGLTADEQSQLWLTSGDVLNDAIRAFCQKNKLPAPGATDAH